MKTTNIQTVPHAIKNRFKQAKFPLLFSVFSMAVVITLGSCSSSGSMMNTSYDDVYGIPSKKEMTASANAAAKTQQNANTSDYYTGNSKISANVENENTAADNRNFDQIQEEYRQIPSDQTLSQAETQATEEAYASDFEMDDYYDYAYAARLKRFYGDDISDRYYSDFYTNLYWYTGDPYYYGTSIYLGYNFWYPSSFYYRPGWYLGFSYGGFGYPSFGWGWGGSYWNGYWNGYMNGLYAGHWGHNCWGSYCYNPYDYNTYTQSYYGPRTGSGNTTGLPSRSPGLSTVSRDNPSGGRGASSTTDRTTTLATRPNGSVQGSSSSSSSTRLPNTTIDGPTTDRTTTLATRPSGPVQGSSSSSSSTRLPNTTIDGPTTEVSRPTFPEMYESSVSRQEMKVETGTKTPDIARPNTSTKLAETSDRASQSYQSTSQEKAPSNLIDRTSNRLERTSSTANRVSGTSNGVTVSRPTGNTSVVGRDNNHTIEATQKGQAVYGTSRGGNATVNSSQSRGTNTISREAAAARQYQSPSYQRTPSNSSYSSPQYNRENTTYTPSRQSSTRSTATPSRSTSSTPRTVTQPSRTQQQRTSPSTYTSPSPSRSFSTPSSSGVRSSGSSSSGGSRSSGGSSSGGRR